MEGLKAVGEAKSTVYEKDAVCEHTRYFITTLTDIKEFAHAVRSHWAIENNLHWSLDVIFREDAARARKDNSPLCMNVLRKTALFPAQQCQIRTREQEKDKVYGRYDARAYA